MGEGVWERVESDGLGSEGGVGGGGCIENREMSGNVCMGVYRRGRERGI